MEASRPSISTLSRSGHRFVSAVILAGTALFAHTLWTVTHQSIPWQWVLFAALTILGGTLTIRVPSMPARLSVSEMFAFMCVLLFGPAPGALTLAVDGIYFSLRRKLRPQRALFNAAELCISIWVGSHLFFRLSGLPPLYQQSIPMGEIIPSLIVMTAVYYLLNSGLMALAIGFETRTSALAVWRRHFVWLVPNYFAGASVSLLLIVALRQVSFSAIALVPPLLLLFYLTVRSSMGRVEDADRHVARVNQLYLSTIETLATAIDAKDEVTHGHIRRVQRAAVELARALGENDPDTIKAIEAAALLHDTGKLAIPEHILNKPGKLTEAEFEIMKQHARIGAEILAQIDFPYPVVPIVRHHHENWDGTGYPDGLAGTDIPIGARILSVVDCFDALRSNRPYRRQMSVDASLAILQERSGKMYDPRVAQTFARLHHEIISHNEEAAVSTAAPSAERPVQQPQMPSAPAHGHAHAASPDHAVDMLALSSLSRALSPEGSVADTMALVWAHLRRLVPARMVAFYVHNSNGNEVELRQACGIVPPGLTGLKIQAGHGVSGWVAANRRLIMNSDAALDFGEAAHAVEPRLQSCLSAPLLLGDALLGVVTVYSDITSPFGEDHGRLLQAVAPHIAESFHAALERASTTPASARSAAESARRQTFHVVSRR